jgi:hypothetical protein
MIFMKLVPMTARSEARTLFDRSNTGIVGSSVCPRFSVLCCPVQVENLRRADLPSKESYQNIQIDS